MFPLMKERNQELLVIFVKRKFKQLILPKLFFIGSGAVKGKGSTPDSLKYDSKIAY